MRNDVTFRERFAYLLVAAIGLATASLFLEPDQFLYWMLYVSQWSLVVYLGIEATRYKKSLLYIAVCALPFAAIDFLAGSISFASRYWTHGATYEGVDLKLAYSGYVLATILFLPIAPILAMLGALGMRVFQRVRNMRSKGSTSRAAGDSSPVQGE